MRGMSPPAAVTAAVVIGSLASCSSDTSGSNSATYDIKAGNSACKLEQQRVPAGNAVFKVENTGSDVTEVYVYGKDGAEFTRIVGEVENIGPGTTRDFAVALSPGDYEVACKPGMVGDGVRSRLTVTGNAEPDTPTADSAGEYDRELEVTVSSSGGVDFPTDSTATTGDVVEFKLHNESGDEHYLEVVGPGGAQVGVTEAAPGAEAEFIAPLRLSGDYFVMVYADGHKSSARSLTLTVREPAQASPTKSTGSGEAASPSGSTPSPTAPTSTATEPDSPPGRALQALVPAGMLPGFNPQWTWDQAAPLRGHHLPSPCMLSSLESIGAVKEAGRSYASRSGSATDSAAQLTGVFPDEHTALTAVAVLTAWHDKCAASAAAAGLGHVKVSQLRDVPTSAGIGKQWMLSYRPVAGQPQSAGFVSSGFVRDGDTISVLVYRNAGQDYNYEVGHEPIDMGLAAAGDYLMATR